MQRTHRWVLITLTAVEAAFVGLGLWDAVAIYLEFGPHQYWRNGLLGPRLANILFIMLAVLPLIGLFVYVVYSAVRQRRWAWVGAAILSVGVGVGVAHLGASGASGPIVAAVLGAAYGGFDAAIAYFVALAVVALTCLAYALWSALGPRPAA